MKTPLHRLSTSTGGGGGAEIGSDITLSRQICADYTDKLRANEVIRVITVIYSG